MTESQKCGEKFENRACLNTHISCYRRWNSTWPKDYEKFKILLKFWELFGSLAYLEPKNFSLLFHHEEPFISLIVFKPGQTHPKVEQEHNKWLPRPYDLHPSQENNLTATFIWPKAFISCSQHNRCSNLTEVEIVKPGCGRFDLLIEAESGIRGVISSWQLDWITHHRSDH